MDINDFRTLATVLMFIVIVGIAWWAYGPSRKAYFEQAAQLPFDGDEDSFINKTSSGVSPAKGEQA